MFSAPFWIARPSPFSPSYRKRELSYGKKDLMHTYTLCVDDKVTFNIATYKRDHMQRATNLTLAKNFSDDSKVARETVSVKTSSYTHTSHWVIVVSCHPKYHNMNKKNLFF